MATHLVQLLVPLYDRDGEPFARGLHDGVTRELTERFGGVTTWSRAPASGFWKQEGKTERDDLAVYEVMVDTLDEPWWTAYRRELEQRFAQDELVVRAQEIRRL